MEPSEETPSTSATVKEEIDNDDDGPPNLLIDEEDDGYPNTPPILEREDYYMENEDVELEPAPEEPPVPNKYYLYESEFYLPENLRRLNPRKYVAHSRHLLLDLICILCQRVCNEAHAVSCYANHRFCKDCIIPRLEKYGFCPRCGDKALGPAKPDPTYDRIIERMRFRKDKVNYVCLEPEKEREELTDSDSDEEIDDEDSEADYESSSGQETPTPAKTMGDQRHEFGEFLRKELERIKAERDAMDKNEPEEAKKRRELLRKRIPKHACPPYKLMQEHQLFDTVGDMLPPNQRNLLLECARDGIKGGVYPVEEWMLSQSGQDRFRTFIPPRWNPMNLRKPLQNMAYKTFWFNKDIEWPKNEPPPHPYGLTPSKLRDIKMLRKARKTFWNDPFLSKREKKISFHKFVTTGLEECFDVSEFESSSDDDEPPPKFCKYRFDYPANYRQPKKDWRRLYDEDGNVLNGVKSKVRRPKELRCQKMVKKWKRSWGEPLQLVRESSSKSAVTFKELSRCYLGAPNKSTIGHIQKFVFRKIALLKNMKLEDVQKRFSINFHPVQWHNNGRNVNVIRCTDAQQPVISPKKKTPVKSPEKIKSPEKPLPPPPMPCNLEPVFPTDFLLYQNRTPTVRELAIKTMKMGIKINPEVMDAAQVNQLQVAVSIVQSPEKPTAGKNNMPYQYKPRIPRHGYRHDINTTSPAAHSFVSTPLNSGNLVGANSVQSTSGLTFVSPLNSGGRASSSAVPIVPSTSGFTFTSTAMNNGVQTNSVPTLQSTPGLTFVTTPLNNGSVRPMNVVPLPPSTSSLTLVPAAMNHGAIRPTNVVPVLPSTSAAPIISPLVSLTNGQTSVANNAQVVVVPSPKKTPKSAEPTNGVPSGSAQPAPGSPDGPPVLVPMGRPPPMGLNPVGLNEPNPRLDKYFTPPPNQPIVNTNPLLNLEGKEGLLTQVLGRSVSKSQTSKRPALQPRPLVNGLSQANALAVARALPPGATLTGVSGLRPSALAYPTPVSRARSGFQAIKLAGPSTETPPINLVPFVTQGDQIQYMQLTPDGKCIPIHTSALGGNILAITPPKGGNGVQQGPTFLKPMTSRDGKPYLQQVEPIIMQQQSQPQQQQQPAPVSQGAAVGRRLSKNVTAFFINTPHVVLNLHTRLGDLRKQARLKKGGRLVLCFSIKDLKTDKVITMPAPRAMPQLQKKRKSQRQERCQSNKQRRIRSTSHSEDENKKEDEDI